MRILILSDLHIAFGNYKVRNVDADVILIAGDSCEGWAAANMYEYMCREGYQVIFVAGNHEYYGKKFSEVNDYWKRMQDRCNGNFHFLNNEVLELGGFRFVGTTLWSEIPPQNEMIVKETMSDYTWIYFKNMRDPVLPYQINELHREAKTFLENNLQQGDILMLHHAPSWASVPEKYVEDPVTCAYVGDIESLILERKPKLVQHGHLHSSVDYMIGDTRVIANPRGYMGHTEYNKNFDPKFVIDLNQTTPDQQE